MSRRGASGMDPTELNRMTNYSTSNGPMIEMSEISAMEQPTHADAARLLNNPTSSESPAANPPEEFEMSEMGESASTIASTVEETAAGLETAEAVASKFSIGQPEIMGMIVAQQSGNAINESLSTSQTNKVNAQFSFNSSQGVGLGAQSHAAIIQQYYQNQANTVKAGGTIGSILGGPVGMMIGRGLASLGQTQIAQNLLNTAWSAGGRIDPQSDNVNISQSAASIPSSEMSNGAQISESSNAQDISSPI